MGSFMIGELKVNSKEIPASLELAGISDDPDGNGGSEGADTSDKRSGHESNRSIDHDEVGIGGLTK